MSQKKYKVIAKVENDKFVKYNVNNLYQFANFLDKSFPDWRYFNVYAYTKEGNGNQLGSYTRHRRPDRKYIE